MAQDTHPPHLCYLTQCEERDAILHQRYLAYLVRFDRWSKPKGWARYMARHPLAALAALTRGQELPPELCHQPLSRDDFVSEIFWITPDR
jgi:hypothetical protein